MADYRMTLIFNAGRHGWTEAYYLTGQAGMDAVRTRAGTLASKRAEALASTNMVDAVRISDLAVTAAADLYYGPWWGLIDREKARDQIEVAWLYRAHTADFQYRRNLYFRGAIDDMVQYDAATGRPLGSGGFSDAIASFLNHLTGGGYAISVISKDPAKVGKVDVLKATAEGQFITYSAPGHTYVLKDKIRVSGLQGTGAGLANKTATIVQTVAGQSFSFAADEDVLGPINTTKPGVARRQVKVLVPISGTYSVRPTTHDTGRAFFAGRGRRKSKA